MITSFGWTRKLRLAEFRSMAWIIAREFNVKCAWCQNHLPEATSTLGTDIETWLGDTQAPNPCSLWEYFCISLQHHKKPEIRGCLAGKERFRETSGYGHTRLLTQPYWDSQQCPAVPPKDKAQKCTLTERRWCSFKESPFQQGLHWEAEAPLSERGTMKRTDTLRKSWFNHSREELTLKVVYGSSGDRTTEVKSHL